MEELSLIRKLDAQALSLLLINCAKHKAAGKTHRVAVRIYGLHSYRYTAVFYVKAADPARYAELKALELGSRVVDYEVREL